MAKSDSEETRRLLAEVRAGKREAAGRLLVRHRPFLRQVVALRLDPRVQARVDASDVVQEAQMEASRRLEEFVEKSPMSFRLWLRQIAYDRLLMLHRRHLLAGKRTVRREVSLPEMSSLVLARQLFAGTPEAGEHLARRELIRRVHAALAALDDDDCEILLLRHYEGLDNQEAAQVLNINPTTASKRYGRALLRLRERLVEM